ncbi:hypothetical protein VKT23_014463 [Stygiomarasmius scandens]|uniref:Uncharacterized protein n=1 Tax=Marasmiellus scandens TaxID=2682957 RepID=A0ABR1J2E5_9AGAR
MYAVFLDTNWKEIGTRWGLRDVLSTITTIPVQIFEGRDIDEYSIAQKMSWAAYRQTTRPEDQAYCLMGIFNVNMPPIYGEGGVAAFMRLQQEIIKVSDDRSIFAWTSKSEDDSKVRGLLARSPEEFRASGGVRMADLEESSIGAKSSFSFANNGLRIHLPIAPNRNGSSSSEGTIFLASLHCCCPCERHSTGSCLFIYLQKIGEQQYVRYRPNEVVVTSSSAESKDWKEVVIKENSLPRKAKRSSGSETKIVDIRLSSSNQQQLRQFTAHKPPIVDSIIVRMGYLTSTLLYDPSSAFHKDSFSLVLGISASRDGVNGTVETVAAIQGNIRNNPTLLDGIPNQCLPADSVQLPMKKGLMHAHLQMTGTVRRILEIYYELMDDQSQIMLQPEPPILGCVFTVPLSVGGLPYEFVGILPRYSFDRGLRSSRYDYIPVYTNNPRLLIYREQNSEPRFFVVLGLHESGEVWTDVWWSSEYNHQTLDYEKMWLSYLDSGHRKPKAASASATIDHHSSRWDIATTVQKIQDTTLQIGSHLLRFDTKTNDT